MVSRKRSPNYPSIDLGKAVDRARELYKHVERGEFTQLDAAQAWGYKGINGNSKSAVGALRQYGLIEQQKGDHGKLTLRGLTIALRDTTSPEYQESVRLAALEPSLFQEIYSNGKGNSARDALRQFLVMEKDFTNDGASRFMEVWNATKTLAHLGEHAEIWDAGQGVTGDTSENELWVNQSDAMDDMVSEGLRETGNELDSLPSSNRTRIPLRLLGGFEAEVVLPSDMTEAAWNHMIQYLNVMRPAYVVAPNSVPQGAPISPLDLTDQEQSESAEDGY